MNKLSERSLFLHFINREVHFIKQSQLKEADHIALIKRAGLMTTGCLVAPFAQVSELYAGKTNVNRLIMRLSSIGKFVLYSGAADFRAFLDTRQEMYAARKDIYPHYFGKDIQVKDAYRPSASLDTTSYIKRVMITAVTQGLSTPNLISNEEAKHLASHRNFITTTLIAGKQAATFSLYETQEINPKPAEVIFFGEISSRLFINHYSATHDLIVPTGVHYDTKFETYDKYPYFDFDLQSLLLMRLGLNDIVSDEIFHDPYINIVSDPDMPGFCAKREELFAVLAHVAEIERLGPQAAYLAIKPLLLALEFDARYPSWPPNALALRQSIDDALRKAYQRDPRFAAAKELLNIMVSARPVVLLMTATPLEDVTFRAQATIMGYQPSIPRTFQEFTGTLYRKGDGSDLWHVRTSAGSAGVSGSARVAEVAIRELKPSFVFAVGIAFGLYENKQKPGDVLVAETIFPYERGRLENGTFKRRGEILSCSPQTTSFASQYDLIESSFRVFTGPVFSGEKLVDDDRFTDFLRKLDDKAIGGEMEASGIVQACQVLSVPFSLIKGIADFGHKKGDKDQSTAAQNAFKFFFEVFGRFDAAGTFRINK